MPTRRLPNRVTSPIPIIPAGRASIRSGVGGTGPRRRGMTCADSVSAAAITSSLTFDQPVSKNFRSLPRFLKVRSRPILRGCLLSGSVPAHVLTGHQPET
ncbi:hypothetical protein GCM10009548_82660 [Streptomyces malaysiensis subsp. malaysiensis]